MRKLLVVLGLLAMATSVQAAVLNYELEVNGHLVTNIVNGVPTIDKSNAAQMSALGLTAGQPFDVQILAMTDAKTVSGSTSGLVMFSFNLDSAAGHMTPSLSYMNAFDPDTGDWTGVPDKDTTNTYLLWGGKGEQDGSGTPPMFNGPAVTTNYNWAGKLQGQINAGGHLVFTQTAYMDAGSLTNVKSYKAFGAGVYSLVSTGQMTWDGTKDTTLTVSGNAADQLVWNNVGGTMTSDTPTAVNPYTIGFVVPEPVTMTLLAIGGLGLLARRNRR